MKIYLASSWRNEYQPDVLATLRRDMHEVYDFRNPIPGNTGFKWSAINPNWESWDAPTFIDALDHPVAEEGYAFDKEALDWCNACVCLLPSGKSAHLEAGYCIGKGKPTFFLLWGDEVIPELMYKLAAGMTSDMGVLIRMLRWCDQKELFLERQAKLNFRSEP